MLRRIRELFNDVLRQADLLLLALCGGTSLFGILMVASATRYMHTNRLVLVQAAALVLGVLLYLVVSQIDVGELVKYWKWIFLVGIGFILLLATPLGIDGGTGNRAWLEFPFLPVKVQPAEIVKITFILVLAKQLAWLKENRDLRSVTSIGMLAIHFGVIFVLYYKISSDMGSALVFLFIESLGTNDLTYHSIGVAVDEQRTQNNTFQVYGLRLQMSVSIVYRGRAAFARPLVIICIACHNLYIITLLYNYIISFH